jgi:enoyl-CoA hydratase/carnithine racemase
MSDDAPVLVERRGSAGLVVLNRPAKLNALNSQLVAELEVALRQLESDDEIGAIVITGAGERAFSAGGDMAEQVARLDGSAPGPPRKSASEVVRACRKPILAAIRGYCYGGGALLAINCDIRIAADDARFKFHGASYGQAPGGAVLARVVGDPKARELLFTGDEVDAAEALEIGLVNHVAPPDKMVETAMAMAERIAANSPAAVATLKEVVNLTHPTEQALSHERAADRRLRESADSAQRFRRAARRVIGPAAES